MLKRLIWLVCAAYVCAQDPAPPVDPAPEPGPLSEQDRVLNAGRAALADGFHQLAEKHFRAFIAAETRGEAKSEAVLLLAEALHERGRYEEVLSMFDEHATLVKHDLSGFTYGRARSLFALERYEESLDLCRRSPVDRDDSRFAALKRLQARGLLKLSKHDEAMALFAQLEKDLEGRQELAEVRLDWAAALIQAGQPDEAETRLKPLIAPGATAAPGLAREADYWLARILAGREEFEGAEPLFRKVAAAVEVAPETRADAWIQLSSLYAKGTNQLAAVQALLEAEKFVNDDKERTLIRLDRARLMLQAGQSEEGSTLLRKQVTELGDAPEAGEAMLFLARHQLDTEDFAGAEKTSQQYLDFFSGDAGRAEADLLKGWALYHQKRYAEAGAEFDKAYENLKAPDQRKEAFLKSADAQFEAGAFEIAREKYLAYTRRFPGDPLLPQALFQSSLCLVRTGELDKAERELQRFQFIYPSEKLAERALLQVASIQVDRGAWEKAIEIYVMYLQEYREGEFVSNALLNRGIAEYRLGRFDEAQKSFEEIMTKHPDSPSRQRASYMRGWALYLGGNETEALAAFNKFVETFPDSKWSEHVLFRMAEHYYNRRNFQQAEALFSQVVETFAEGELKEKALYWAGRSAYSRDEFKQALEFFKLTVEQFPESSRAADALFWQGHTLSRLGEYATAVLIFDRIIKDHPNSYLYCMAWGRKGDSLITLGDKEKDESKYVEAQAAFQTMVDTNCSLDLQLEAGCKIAETLDKLKKSDQALQRYLEVFYKHMNNRDKLGSSSDKWLARAALTAAQMLEDRGEYREAIAVYLRLKGAGLEASKVAEKRIQKIKVEQLIIF